MLKNLIDILSTIIYQWGYLGIFVSTGLEYACFPVSSEILLPFIGYSVAATGLKLHIAILYSTLGGICGSFACYWFGRFLGCFIENTLCKKFSSLKNALDNASKFFNKNGNSSVMIGRIFPIVRTYISIPAGMAKMDIKLFLLYSGVGALVWNTVLIGCGFLFGEHLPHIGNFISNHSMIICISLAIIVVVFRKIRHR